MKKMISFIAVAILATGVSWGAKHMVSDAGTVAYLNPGAKIYSGQIVDLGYRYGVAATDIPSNSTRTVFTEGIWRLARFDTNAIALGANVYQNSASNVTGTAAAGHYIGECVKAVTVTTALVDSLGRLNKYVEVDIGSPQKQIIVGLDTQAYNSNLDVLALGLASNKVWIGSAAGIPAAFPLTGLFTTTVGGVAAGVAGYSLPAYDGAAVTNLAGGNIASGDIAIARMAEALKAPGTIGGTTPGDASFASAGVDSLAVGDKAGQAGTVAVRDGTIDTFTINASGMVDIGAWGYTGEHVGLVDDGSGNTVPGFGQYNEVKTEIAGGKVLAAKYTRLLVSSNQVNDVTCIGHESQFRLRGANLGNGVHAGLWAYAEQSGTSVLSDNGTFDAITATVESEAGFEVGATEQVSGITLDSSINSGATIAGAANFSAVYIKSNGLDWFNGLYITGCDNAILFDGGATIDQSAADTLTLTEDKVNVAGAFTATTIEADNGITSNFTFLSATATTGRMWFSGGILTNVTLTGE